MNRYETYGSTASVFGLGAHVSGGGILVNYPRTAYNWAFYTSPTTRRGGAKDTLQDFFSKNGIASNGAAPYASAPGSNATRSGNIAISRFNHNQAVAAQGARIQQSAGSSLFGSIVSNQSDPLLRTSPGDVNGAGRRTLDAYHQTRSYWSGATDTFTEVKTGVTGFTGDVRRQAIADAANLKLANANVALPRNIGMGLRVGGAALGAAGFAYDGYSTYVDINEQLAEGNGVGAGRSGADFIGRQAGGLFLGYQGALAGAALGQIAIPIPGVGAAIGAVAGGVAGGFGGAALGEYLAGAGYDGVVNSILGSSGSDWNRPSPGSSQYPPLEITITRSGQLESLSARYGQTLPANQYGSSSEFDDVFNSFNGSMPDGIFSNGASWSSGWSIDTSALGSGSFSSGYDFNDFNWSGSSGFDSGSFYDYGFSSNFGFGSSFSFGNPVVLDLNGDGVSLTELGQSTTFFDMAGDGRNHQTAWAAAGDGVLAFDANGDGKITQRNEVIFTDWDSAAATDMQALLNVFDTNKDGKLGAGDAKIASFGLLVVDKNGESTFKSLSAAGVASISLREDQFKQVLADGSSIDGETTFTKTSGATGKAATVTLAYDAEGRAVSTSSTANADGSTTIVKGLRDPSGQIVGTIIAKTSADGLLRTLTIDHDGDSVVDERQKDQTVVAADGVKTKTVTYSDAANVVTGVTTTTTSADGRTDTILRDTDGNGVAEQREVVTRAADGTKSVAVSDLNPNGSVKATTTHTTSANGQTGTTQSDLDGDGDYDLKRVTTVALGTSRVETVTETNIDTTKRSSITTTTSLDGATQTVQTDANGDGSFETSSTSALVRNSDGGTTRTETLKSASGVTLSVTRLTTSADGLTIKTEVDANADGTFDETKLDKTVIDASGTQTQTVTTTNAAGGKLDATTTVKKADGITRTTDTDADGDGANDVAYSVTKDASGVVTETTVTYAPNRSVVTGRTVVTTSADGLTKSTDVDINGDGLVDSKSVVATVKNANGSSTVTATNRDRSGVLLTQTITATSVDGLTTTTSSNVDGGTSFDFVNTSTKVVAADKSETTTVTTKSASGTLLGNSVSKLSADRNRTDVTLDANGDGKTDQTQSTVRSTAGAVIDTVKTFAENGALITSVVTSTSPTGLTKTVVTDIDGDGATDETTSDATVLNNDGGNTRTLTVSGSGGALRSKTVTTTDDVGLSVTTQSDVDGNGAFDYLTTDVTTLGSDGGRVRTVTSKTASGTMTGSVVTTTSGNGLSVTTKTDSDGDGDFDLTTTDVVALATDGSQNHTIASKNIDGTVRNESVTATSADRKTVTVSQNLDGKTGYDNVLTTQTTAAGKIVETEIATQSSTQIYKRVRETAADGLSWLETIDANGNGTTDANRSYAVTINANGSKTEVSKDDNINDNVLIGSDGNTSIVTTTTSADSLRKDVLVSGNNAGFPINHEFHSVKTINADGSTLETRNSQYTNGSTAYFLSRMRVTESADHDSRVVEIDMNGQAVGSGSPAFTANIRKETLVGTDGATTETYSQFRANGAVADKTVTITSGDGQDVTVKRDIDGDGTFNLVKSSILQTDGSRVDTIAWYPDGVELNDKTVVTTSADGLTATTQYDYDGDGAFDAKMVQASVVGSNGATTNSRADYNANGTLRSRVSTTTSANGLTVTGTIDLDGNGVVDENYSSATVLNNDGSTVATVTTTYADTATLKNKTVTTTSGDGRTVKTEEDYNGDGKNDLVRVDIVDASGDTTSTTTYYKNGVKVSGDISEISADGRLTRVNRDFNGDGTVDYVSREGHLADGLGSYDIAAADAWTAHFEGNHWLDENGVDHMRVQVEGGSQYARTLTTDQRSQDLGRISRAYDILLDRDMTSAEQQGYIQQANYGLIIDKVLASAEFKNKYGTLTDAQFIQRLYENAYGYDPKIGALDVWMGYLNQGVTRTNLVDTFAESSLHLIAGNTHAVTNNSRDTSGKFTLDHTTDRLVAEGSVEALFQTMLDRAATAAEKSSWGAKILSGANTESQIAASLLAADFKTKYGTLTNEQFVSRLFQNGLNRAPNSTTELSVWKTRLDNGTITRADLVVGIAESPDYFSAQGAARQQMAATSAEPTAGQSVASTDQTSSASDQSSLARMVQAMSTMSVDHGAISSFGSTQSDQSQTQQLAASHG